MSEEETIEINCHPLFLDQWAEQLMKENETDEPLDIKEELEERSARIVKILVARRMPGATGPVNPRQFTTCQHPFGPGELLQETEIAELFGGGEYMVIARDSKQMVGKAFFRFEGKQKPLEIGGKEEVAAPQTAIVQQLPIQGELSSNQLMMMMMNMQQKSTEMMMASQQQSAQMMMNMMVESSKTSATVLQAVIGIVANRQEKTFDPEALVRSGMELSQRAHENALKMMEQEGDDEEEEQKPKSMIEEAGELYREFSPVIDILTKKDEPT